MPTNAELISAAAAVMSEAERRDLGAFIAKIPGFHRPEHLRPYLDVLERSRREPVRAVVAAPPRHGKSESTLAFIVQSLILDPCDRLGYATYAAEFSEQQAKRAAFIAELAGLKLKEKRASYWRTHEGGEVIWTSIGGPLTGKGVRKLFVDDPVKGRAEAESATYREAAWQWFNAVAYTRLEPGGSIVCMATRWHPDDLSGRLIGQGWTPYNLKAIGNDGRALWPERYPLDALEKIRLQIGEYEWSSLYQGEPRSKGGRVFGDVHFYDALPTEGYRVSIGADFAYTSKNYSDYSVAVVLLERGGVHYVADVVRQQVEAPMFRRTLKALRDKWRGRVTAYIGGTEKGVIDFMKLSENGSPDGLDLNALPAIVDKFARAQPAAASWNAGKLLLPRSAPWLDAFTSELVGFTGVSDRHDDQVDALAGAFAPFIVPPVARGVIQTPILAF